MLKDLLKIIDDYRLDKTDLARLAGLSHGGLVSNWARRGSAKFDNVTKLPARGR